MVEGIEGGPESRPGSETGSERGEVELSPEDREIETRSATIYECLNEIKQSVGEEFKGFFMSRRGDSAPWMVHFDSKRDRLFLISAEHGPQKNMSLGKEPHSFQFVSDPSTPAEVIYRESGYSSTLTVNEKPFVSRKEHNPWAKKEALRVLKDIQENLEQNELNILVKKSYKRKK